MTRCTRADSRSDRSLDLEAVEPLVVDAFVTQRRRLLDSVRTLEAAEWSRPSRCTAWNTRELVLHVLGATDACRTTLTGERLRVRRGLRSQLEPQPSSSTAGPEHPSQRRWSSSTTSIRHGQRSDRRAAEEGPAAAGDSGVGRAGRLAAVRHALLLGRVDPRAGPVAPARPRTGRGGRRRPSRGRLRIPHRRASWPAVFGTHSRDRAPRMGREAARTGSSWTASTSGSRSRARIPADGPSNGTAVAVTDAIAGRGPELATVLDASPDVVDALSESARSSRASSPPSAEHAEEGPCADDLPRHACAPRRPGRR